jgi:MFS family permease
LLRDAAFLTALAVAFVVFVIRAGVTSTSVPLFAHEELGLSRGMVGIALTCSAASNLLWLPHAGRLADLRPRRVAVVLGLTAALAGLALLSVSNGLVLLLVAMFVLGIATAYAGVTPAAIIADVAPPARSGMALGTYRMAVDGASVLAPLCAGLIAAAAGFHGVFLAFMAPLALVLLAGLRLRDTRRDRETLVLVSDLPGGDS